VTRRLVALVALVAAVAIAAFAVPTWLALRSLQSHTTQLELEQEAFVAAATLSPEEPLLISSMQPVPSDERHHLALYATDGGLLDGRGPASAEPAVLAALEGVVAHGVYGNDYVVAIPLPSRTGTRTALRVAEPASDARSALQSQRMRLAALAALVLVGSIGVGGVLAVQLTRPIRRLRGLAAELGEGPRPTRPPASGLGEIDDLADTLWQAATRVHMVIDRERAFSAYAAHQLRTPLASARVVAETELAAPRPSPRTALLEVVSCLDRLEDTTDQLMALARGVADHRQPVRLAEMARRAQRRWAAEFSRSARTLTARVSTQATATLSPAAFDQILDVLLDNALDHGSGRTQLIVHAEHDRLCIAVEDEGRIDAGADPFTTRVRRGHGIGLALATALAHAEGWDLTLRQRAPARFTLTNSGTVTPTEPFANAPIDGVSGGGSP
jgi:signal transduction histidine kinase